MRGPLAIAAPVLFAVWALAGFYASLGPAVVRGLADSTSAVYGGLGLFVLAIVAGRGGAGSRTPRPTAAASASPA